MEAIRTFGGGINREIVLLNVEIPILDTDKLEITETKSLIWKILLKVKAHGKLKIP
jgi:hypothetical protein